MPALLIAGFLKIKMHTRYEYLVFLCLYDTWCLVVGTIAQQCHVPGRHARQRKTFAANFSRV